MWLIGVYILCILLIIIAICVTPWQGWICGAIGGLIGALLYKATHKK